ncbi:hypothetical protein SK3146_00893 [Paenibacillus konkukensis]|uniref:Copper amine oxidase-like N-terminal domain-containing protein n=1 Tax=Paenibacillus konkukensis TaxID=2020716 RepID=A0ABY4RHV4_9BACL|nr:hypothetical protein [Paenibacillus konkukensis]UQZ81737.1 hypothetical protein SK3146_00893 [Paenibacillus konkukensis]
MKKIVAGMIIGSVLTISTTALADAVKQYILTEVTYPLFVNGKEYKDSTNPILNYDGSTYVPLAKLGDLTGVNYTWNDQLKRVEIGTDGKSDAAAPTEQSADPATGTPATPGGNITLKPDTKVVNSSGLAKVNGAIVYTAYKNGDFIGIFTDDDDGELVRATLEGRKTLPPKLSEGWMQSGLLDVIYGYYVVYDKEKPNDLVVTNSPFSTQPEEYLRLTLPDEWRSQENGETTVKNIKIKRYNKINYFNIEDLKKTGILD